jgi:hypothetical protein
VRRNVALERRSRESRTEMIPSRGLSLPQRSARTVGSSRTCNDLSTGTENRSTVRLCKAGGEARRARVYPLFILFEPGKEYLFMHVPRGTYTRTVSTTLRTAKVSL